MCLPIFLLHFARHFGCMQGVLMCGQRKETGSLNVRFVIASTTNHSGL